jgi:hypothetical protein
MPYGSSRAHALRGVFFRLSRASAAPSRASASACAGLVFSLDVLRNLISIMSKKLSRLTNWSMGFANKGAATRLPFKG